MSLLKNIRSNFFSNKSSFSVGFGNRSPLSVYSSAYVPTDYSAPKVPRVSSSPSDWYDPTRTEALKTQQKSIMKVGQNIVKHIESIDKKTKSKPDPCDDPAYRAQIAGTAAETICDPPS